MVRRNTTLSVENELLTIAKAKGINISQMVNSMLEIEIGLGEVKNEKDELSKLRNMNIKLTSELQRLTKKLDKIEAKSQVLAWK